MIAGAAFAILLTLQAQAATPPPRPISVDAGIEWRADRYSYRADNPSTIDTPDLVPHFFTQHYRADAAWFTAAAHYTVLNGDADTRIAIAPAHRTVGSDIDTFFDPSGDVVTSGTDGPIDLRAFELSQRLALASWRGWQLGVTIDYRRSRADFRPDDIVVTHTQPRVRHPHVHDGSRDDDLARDRVGRRRREDARGGAVDDRRRRRGAAALDRAS